MPGPAAILRELHRLRRHARDLQTEIDRGPRLFKAQQTKAARQEELLKETQELIKKLKVKNHDKEGELKVRQEQLIKHQRQLNIAASKKEYDALQQLRADTVFAGVDAHCHQAIPVRRAHGPCGPLPRRQDFLCGFPALHSCLSVTIMPAAAPTRSDDQQEPPDWHRRALGGARSE